MTRSSPTITGEHALLAIDGATLQVVHDGEVTSVDESAVVIVPAWLVEAARHIRAIRVCACTWFSYIFAIDSVWHVDQ